MIVFWVAAAFAVVVVLALLFRPFLLKSKEVNVSRRELNAAIYRDQLARLDRDRAENTLADADYDQARAELQRRVIDDTAEADVTSRLQAPRKTMVAVGLLLPVAAIGLYLLLGTPATLEPNGPQHAVTAQDMDRLIVGLAQKLEKEPDNLQGWAMLARSYKMMGRNMEAEMAFVRAGSYLDNDAQLLAIYADLAATNANGNFAGKPAQLIEKALKVDPESEDGRMLQGSIDAAYAAIGKAAPKATAKAPVKGPTVSANDAGSTQQKTGPESSVSGQVELDASLKGKAAPNDTVMVIARAPGSRMPVAVVRANASELPLKFTLDDSLAMSPQARISMSSQIEVEARISKSGMAQPESGDLISVVQTVKLGTRNVKLQVNKVRP